MRHLYTRFINKSIQVGFMRPQLNPPITIFNTDNITPQYLYPFELVVKKIHYLIANEIGNISDNDSIFI